MSSQYDGEEQQGGLSDAYTKMNQDQMIVFYTTIGFNCLSFICFVYKAIQKHLSKKKYQQINSLAKKYIINKIVGRQQKYEVSYITQTEEKLSQMLNIQHKKKMITIQDELKYEQKKQLATNTEVEQQFNNNPRNTLNKGQIQDVKIEFVEPRAN